MSSRRLPLATFSALVVAAGIALSACSSAPATDQPTGSEEAGAPPSGRLSPPASGGVVPGAVPADVLDDVVTAAAAEAGVDPADVTLVSAEPVTWGDGSLGCPQPGMMYTQALVDGYQVVVKAGGEELDYRVGNGQVRLCEGFQPGGSGG